MLVTYDYVSKIGVLRILYEDGVVSLSKVDFALCHEYNEDIKRVIIELDEYFNQKRESFDFPFKITGTAFEQKVYQEVRKIPFGQVSTYYEIGQRIGSKAYRAIGNALHKNPLLLIVPCHRVVSKHSIGGFGLGIETKKYLLKLERIGCARDE